MWKEEVKARIPEFDFTLKNQLVEWWLTPSDCLWRVLLRALCKIYNIKIKFVSSPEVADFRDLVACLSLSLHRGSLLRCEQRPQMHKGLDVVEELDIKTPSI